MTTIEKLVGLQNYVDHFDALTASAFKDDSEQLITLRKNALDVFIKRGFPTTKDEAWRHTNLANVAKVNYQLPPEHPDEAGLGPTLLNDAWFIMLVNGRFIAEQSIINELPPGLTIRSLARAVDEDLDLINLLGTDLEDDPLSALNTALWQDGLYIHVAKGVSIERPLQIIQISSTAEDEAIIVSPRLLVHAEENSYLTIFEEQLSNAGAITLTSSVTDLHLAAGANVEYVQLQQEASTSVHITMIHATQNRDSKLTLFTANIGGALARTDVVCQLIEPGANVSLNGYYLVRGRQHMDIHSRIEHQAPDCTSSENYAGILDDQGRGVFNGRVLVHPGAQKTDASQLNHNLILSDGALVNTNPQLEIYADDVKCNHGSSVGQMDEESIFYLRTRGLDKKSALQLLIRGFATEPLSGVRSMPLRQLLADKVEAWLPEKFL